MGVHAYRCSLRAQLVGTCARVINLAEESALVPPVPLRRIMIWQIPLANFTSVRYSLFGTRGIFVGGCEVPIWG